MMYRAGFSNEKKNERKVQVLIDAADDGSKKIPLHSGVEGEWGWWRHWYCDNCLPDGYNWISLWLLENVILRKKLKLLRAVDTNT